MTLSDNPSHRFSRFGLAALLGFGKAAPDASPEGSGRAASP